jgi:hypothetical protein
VETNIEGDFSTREATAAGSANTWDLKDTPTPVDSKSVLRLEVQYPAGFDSRINPGEFVILSAQAEFVRKPPTSTTAVLESPLPGRGRGRLTRPVESATASASESTPRPTPAPETRPRKSLVGKWSAAACVGGLVITADDGQHMQGVCDTGILHRVSGTYVNATTIQTTVTRIDKTGCQSQATGRWTIENDHVLTTFQEGWNDPTCGVMSDSATEVLRRLE